MNTIKTTFVVIVLLAVLYGVYVVLNKPEPNSSDAGQPWENAPVTTPNISTGVLDDSFSKLGPASDTPPSHLLSPPQDGDVKSFDGEPAERFPETSNFERPAGFHLNDHELRSFDIDRAPPLVTDGNPTEPTPISESTDESTGDGGGYSVAPAAATSDSYYRSQVERTRGDLATADLQNDDVERVPNQGEALRLDRTHGSSAFAAAWTDAQNQIRAGQFRKALATLTPYYGSTDLTAAEQEKLVELLDPLAGKVIYSTEHLMSKPYIPARGESLRDIAEAHEVPWELLRNINRIEHPAVLAPGVQLKVLHGPFRAEIELSKSQLTLFVGELYAGRFDIEVHQTDSPMNGKFLVKAREQWPHYQAGERLVEPKDPRNPYGQWLLDLGGGITIHSSSPTPESAAAGCISLSPQDAGDVYGILSVGSKVEIRR